MEFIIQSKKYNIYTVFPVKNLSLELSFSIWEENSELSFFLSKFLSSDPADTKVCSLQLGKVVIDCKPTALRSCALHKGTVPWPLKNGVC